MRLERKEIQFLFPLRASKVHVCYVFKLFVCNKVKL